MPLRKILFILLVFCCALAAAVGPYAWAAESAKVMIVLDASGSMWGRIGKKTKIEIAREVIADLLKGWDPKIQLGVSAYGHRRKGDCKDIELLVPVSKPDPKAIMRAVNALQPKGMTPLSQSVVQAAETLKYTEQKATVILVTDGKETCKLDPCEVGKKLEETGVDFTAHVIGFDVKKSEQVQLQCLAKNTGGLFLSAKDAPSLRQALGKAVKKAAAPAPPSVRLSGVYKEGGEPIRRDVRWYVFDLKKDGKSPGKRIRFNSDPVARLTLPAGRYFVRGIHHDARVERVIEVKGAGREEYVLNFNAGSLRLSAVLKEGDKPVRQNVGWYVYEAQADIRGKRRRISYQNDPSALFTLPAGRYRIAASFGEARAYADVEVKAGAMTEQVLNLDAGYLKLGAVLKEGGKPVRQNVGWYVYEGQADVRGKRRRISYQNDPSALFTLPAGRYRIAASLGEARAYADVEVKAGAVTEQVLNLNAGSLRLSAVRKGGGQPLKGSFGWYVYEPKPDAQGNRRRITFSSSASPLFILSAGRYYIVGSGSGLKGRVEVEVKAGEMTRVKVPFAKP